MTSPRSSSPTPSPAPKISIEEKASRVFAKLMQDTQDAKVSWYLLADSPNIQFDDAATAIGAYGVTVAGSIFCISKWLVTDRDMGNQYPSYNLALIDASVNVIWEFPYFASLADLYTLAALRAGKVEERLDKFLEL